MGRVCGGTAGDSAGPAGAGAGGGGPGGRVGLLARGWSGAELRGFGPGEPGRDFGLARPRNDGIGFERRVMLK